MSAFFFKARSVNVRSCREPKRRHQSPGLSRPSRRCWDLPPGTFAPTARVNAHPELQPPTSGGAGGTKSGPTAQAAASLRVDGSASFGFGGDERMGLHSMNRPPKSVQGFIITFQAMKSSSRTYYRHLMEKFCRETDKDGRPYGDRSAASLAFSASTSLS
jgi:hypothetical protein